MNIIRHVRHFQRMQTSYKIMLLQAYVATYVCSEML